MGSARTPPPMAVPVIRATASRLLIELPPVPSAGGASGDALVGSRGWSDSVQCAICLRLTRGRDARRRPPLDRALHAPAAEHTSSNTTARGAIEPISLVAGAFVVTRRIVW